MSGSPCPLRRATGAESSVKKAQTGSACLALSVRNDLGGGESEGKSKKGREFVGAVA